MKFEDYQAHGVEECWIIDPQTEIIEQYVNAASGFQLVKAHNIHDSIQCEAIQRFNIPVKAAFYPEENLNVLNSL